MNLTLHLTSSCNMNCSYCYNNGDEYQDDMTFEIARQAIDYAINQTASQIMNITFVGGEPLLKKELIKQIVEYCNQNNEKTILFSILTNGLLLDEQFINFSISHNIAISLSFDGIEKSHNLFRKMGEKDSWKLVYSKFKKLISLIPESMILITLNPETIQYLAESISFLIENGAKAISISNNYKVSWQEEHFELLQAQLIEIAGYYKIRYKNNSPFYLNIFDSRIHAFIDGFVNKGRCAADGNHLSIAPNGDLFPCIAFVKKNSQYKIGSLDSGIDKNKIEYFQKNRRNSDHICKNCDIKERCFNWCACANYLATGRIDSISPALCEFEKMLIPICDRIAEELYLAKNKSFIKRFYEI
ncbi:MAG: radical SAM protein [Candidatus Cloacimonetes bacterium]|nr:radical SAM protein [Candidatus Cloacimonadota bacterium]